MKTSIIILTYNQLDFTQKCVESIRQFTRADQYELIVVDNQSNDGTVEWLQQQADLSVVVNNQNCGLPEGYNQGMELAQGDNVLLLKNDTVVTSGWLDNLLACLYSQEEIGAVGPVTNSCTNYQAIWVNYQNLIEMQSFAQGHNHSDPNTWEERLKLVDYCLLIKQEVLSKVGLFDEAFSPSGFEDDDLSLRIRLAGYKLMVCKDTFIHHFALVSYMPGAENRNKFIAKWGFDPTYSALIRHDIINLIDKPKDQPIKVLDIGCACGGTLLQIKNLYQQAELVGVEFNEQAATSAKSFANVIAADIEKTALPYPQGYFDYIILADVLEHLQDPWQAVTNLKAYLKSDGKVLASIPNVIHFTVVRSLLLGSWRYEDAGILDKTHLRFFTLHEIEKMFAGAAYGARTYQPLFIYESAEDKAFIQRLTSITGNEQMAEQFRVYQYLVRAEKEALPQMSLQKLIFLLRRIEQKIDEVESLQQLIGHLKAEYVTPALVVQAVMLGLVKKEQTLLTITLGCFHTGHTQLATALLEQAGKNQLIGGNFLLR